MEARALSVRQPWATLIVMGRKPNEYRSARTARRGRVFIHAAATMGKTERAAAIREGLDPDALPRGVIIGSVEIVDSVRASTFQPSESDRRRGDYRSDLWAWKLARPEMLARPVPAKGALSFWLVPSSVVDQVETQTGGFVFVYGTLKRGHGNHRLMTGTFLGEDRISGKLYDLGAYPAVGRADGVVHGEVYLVDGDTMARLDRLEGIPHLYQRVRVWTWTGIHAWVYMMAPERLRKERAIASGRWEARA
jgi:gamma-glutamylcyclotransferase (GGCT)/AIG2-like uncharacterized protein YtfP